MVPALLPACLPACLPAYYQNPTQTVRFPMCILSGRPRLARGTALPCPRAGKLGSQLLELAKLTFPQFCAFCDNSRISKPGKPTVQAAQSKKSDQDPETIRIDFKLYVSHMHSGRPPRTHPDRTKPESAGSQQDSYGVLSNVSCSKSRGLAPSLDSVFEPRHLSCPDEKIANCHLVVRAFP